MGFSHLDNKIIEFIKNGQEKHLKKLLAEYKQAIDFKHTDENKNTLLHYAYLYGGSHASSIAQLLRRYGADPLAENNYGLTPFDICYSMADDSAKKWISVMMEEERRKVSLLEHTKQKKSELDTSTPAAKAIEGPQSDLPFALTANSPFSVLANNQLNTLQTLVALPNEPELDEDTAKAKVQMKAKLQEFINYIKVRRDLYLVQGKKAELERTPLMYAVAMGDISIVRALLSYGFADLYPATSNYNLIPKETAMSLALKVAQKDKIGLEIANALLARSDISDINQKLYNPNNPSQPLPLIIHLLDPNTQPGVIKFLLEQKNLDLFKSLCEGLQGREREEALRNPPFIKLITFNRDNFIKKIGDDARAAKQEILKNTKLDKVEKQREIRKIDDFANEQGYLINTKFRALLVKIIDYLKDKALSFGVERQTLANEVKIMREQKLLQLQHPEEIKSATEAAAITAAVKKNQEEMELNHTVKLCELNNLCDDLLKLYQDGLLALEQSFIPSFSLEDESAKLFKAQRIGVERLGKWQEDLLNEHKEMQELVRAHKAKLKELAHEHQVFNVEMGEFLDIIVEYLDDGVYANPLVQLLGDIKDKRKKELVEPSLQKRKEEMDRVKALEKVDTERDDDFDIQFDPASESIQFKIPIERLSEQALMGLELFNKSSSSVRTLIPVKGQEAPLIRQFSSDFVQSELQRRSGPDALSDRERMQAGVIAREAPKKVLLPTLTESRSQPAAHKPFHRSATQYSGSKAATMDTPHKPHGISSMTARQDKDLKKIMQKIGLRSQSRSRSGERRETVSPPELDIERNTLRSESPIVTFSEAGSSVLNLKGASKSAPSSPHATVGAPQLGISVRPSPFSSTATPGAGQVASTVGLDERKQHAEKLHSSFHADHDERIGMPQEALHLSDSIESDPKKSLLDDTAMELDISPTDKRQLIGLAVPPIKDRTSLKKHWSTDSRKRKFV